LTTLTTGAKNIDAQAHRNETAIVTAVTSTLTNAGGVASGLALTKTSGMSFSLGTGRALVPGATAADGLYSVVVTAAETKAFAPGDATRNRIDLVVIQTYPAGTALNGGAMVEVIQGAYPASGSPVVPSTPAGALALFQVPIGAGVSAGNGGWVTSGLVDVRKPLLLLNQQAPTSANLALTGIYQPRGNGLGTPKWVRGLDGQVRFTGVVGSSPTSVTLVKDTHYTLVNQLPVEARPESDKIFLAAMTSGDCFIYVRASGLVTWVPARSETVNPFWISLDSGMSW